ncbi:MAG: hypothetical protein R2685_07950 [Candidatus Nitrosocosmicus sp.]|nr:hypothetical protein [Candidatus Nitrosocosmicus sp.]
MSNTTTAITTSEIEEPKDWAKISNTRRTRGYNFEYRLVNAFNSLEGPKKKHHYHARRLGGSSTGLPDIVVTNKEKSLVYSMECKSSESEQIYIPKDQIERCLDIRDNFLSLYADRYIVFAFKFKASTQKGRKLQYRFVLAKTFLVIKNLKGVSYHIVRDEFIMHYTNCDNIVFKRENLHTDLIPFLTSIDELLRFR